jgi:thiosulfate sulfurtransferase
MRAGAGSIAALAAGGLFGGRIAEAKPTEPPAGVPSVDRLAVRLVTDSYHHAFEPPRTLGSLQVQRLGFAVAPRTAPRRTLQSEWGLSSYARSPIAYGPDVGSMTPCQSEIPMTASIRVARLQELLALPTPPLLLDVRRAPAYAGSPAMIPGACRQLPEAIETWAPTLDRSKPVVAYCVHGHEVSQGVVARLIELGIEACYLEGGIEQWKASGGATASPDA